MSSLVSQDMKKEVTVESIEKGGFSKESCSAGMFSDNRRYRHRCTYERDMPTGGERTLILDEEGDITLTGYEPTLETLGEDGEIIYATDIDSIDYSTESFDDLFEDVQPYSEPTDEIYDELDEILHQAEADAGFLR